MRNIKQSAMAGESKPESRLSDHEILVEIYEFVKDMKSGYDYVTENARIDRATLGDLLGVSTRTIQRWRTNGSLHYYMTKNGSTYYLFKEVLDSLVNGRLYGKGAKRIAAIERMKCYSNGLLKGFYARSIEFDDFCL